MFILNRNGITREAEGAASGGGEAASAAGGEQGSTPATNGSFFTPPADSGNTFLSMLPEEFRNDPTFKDYKTMPDFLKSHKNMASLVGKKAIERPGDGATPEQIKAFRTAIGVPETVDGYQFDDVDLSAYGDAAAAFKKELGDFKQTFMELGIPAKEANELQKKYWGDVAKGLEAANKAGDAKRKAAAEVAAAEAAKFDTEWDQIVKQQFGDNAPQVVDNAKALMLEFANKDDLAIIEKLDNKTLFAFLNTLNGVREKYMSEGNPPSNSGTHTSTQSAEAKRAEGKALYAQIIKLDHMDPKRAELMTKYKAIYANLPAEKEDTTKSF